MGHGLLIHEVSKSHMTHHSRQDSSGRVISSSHRPLSDNTQHSRQTNIHATGGIRTHDHSRPEGAVAPQSDGKTDWMWCRVTVRVVPNTSNAPMLQHNITSPNTQTVCNTTVRILCLATNYEVILRPQHCNFRKQFLRTISKLIRHSKNLFHLGRHIHSISQLYHTIRCAEFSQKTQL